jgi:D-glycero-alpha-D-manno-heptose-7-phosphate kinase
MIITQTPLRISFFGGGTDFRDYFLKEDGWVLSSAIDRHIFVIIKERFDDKIRVGYTKTELVDHIDEVQHDLVRECLRKTGLTKAVEVATMADVPSAGSGMGSSSTVTVGLLNAMYTYQGKLKAPEELAREACEVEIDVLNRPIGIQDQYIAAYGGQRFIRFTRGDHVQVDSWGISDILCNQLSQNLMLFFTKVTRRSETVLSEQVERMNSRIEILRDLKRLAVRAQDCLRAGEFDEFGLLMHQGWEFKKQLASRISNSIIDRFYSTARMAGALGGKITGAGGGGFLLLYCPTDRQEAVRTALYGLPELPFSFEKEGSKVILYYRRGIGRRTESEFRIPSNLYEGGKVVAIAPNS